eukprot:scaffold8090_cov82-Cylindrotheca_fusiformis.AAC.10
MPRTRSTRSRDKKPAEERLQQVESLIHRLIFFQYYYGIISEGSAGFNSEECVPGSAKHMKLLRCLDGWSTNKFYTVGKRMYELAKDFVDENKVPNPALCPAIEPGATLDAIVREVHESTTPQDDRTPPEKLAAIESNVERYIFFKYYDGIISKNSPGNKIGFQLKYGPPGSANHKRTVHTVLGQMSVSQFRRVGVLMYKLADEFFDKGITPDDQLRPILGNAAPVGLIQAAAEAAQDYNNTIII